MKKNILILAFGSLCFVGSLPAMNLDDLYRRIVADAKHENRLPEMVECVKKQKGVLTHSVSGATIFMQIVALYNGVKAELKREEEKVGRLKASLGMTRQHLKCLEEEDNPNMPLIEDRIRSIRRLHRQIRFDVDKTTSLRQEGVGLQEAFRAFLALGKGDTACENYLTVLMAELEKKEGGKPFITALRDTFPDKFPEPVEPEDKEEEDEEDDETFTYTPPTQPGHKEIAVRAFSFQRHLARLNKSYYHFHQSTLSAGDYHEIDLSGATLIRRVAETWYLHSPKTEDQRAGRTTETYTSFFGGRTTYIWYDRVKASEHLEHEFKECLTKAPAGVDFSDLMDCFLENEEGYQPLIEAFENNFPRIFDDYKKWLETHQRPARAPASKEKISAYYFADLFCELVHGDEDELGASFELIKERISLVNACDPNGIPLLHQVLRLYNSEDNLRKKATLALFFQFLLVNGADYTKTCTTKGSTRAYMPSGNYYDFPDVKRPSVEEILEDYTKDFETDRSFDPYIYYEDKLKNPITQGTALFFKQKLDAFKADKRAPFEGRDGEWLEERMPTAPEPKAAPKTESPKKDEKPEEVDFEEILRNYQKNGGKTFWQNWKSSFKYFASGMAVAGIAYWLKNRSWGDYHEELRIQRDLLRAANAQAS